MNAVVMLQQYYLTWSQQPNPEVRLLLQMPLPIGCVPLVLDWMCLLKRLKDMDLQSAAKKRKSILTDLVSQQPKNDLEETNFLDIIPSPTKQEEDLFLKELNICLPSSAVLSLSDEFPGNFIPKTQVSRFGKIVQQSQWN